jgi:predicted PilT family ATPase
VQIVFVGFNEYNFYIVVRGAQYEATKNGLDLVEQEMPASISFHVPDQYHKRIIGIGGQHIQRIMKKYSVFVKFSNAMDRGGYGKEEDDIKVDNVICRTPARNAQNLDLVKQEIMDMVEKADAEFVSETININRLYHRELIARLDKIDELEKKFNCKITFPSTEEASDTVTVSGPEYQVPLAVDEFLVCSSCFVVAKDAQLTIRRVWFQSRTIWPFLLRLSSASTSAPLNSRLISSISSRLSMSSMLSFRILRLRQLMEKKSRLRLSTWFSPGTMPVG